MSEPWEVENCKNADGSFDSEKAIQIVEALDYLRREAKKNSNDHLYVMINSTFNICFVVYMTAIAQMQMLGKFSPANKRKTSL